MKDTFDPNENVRKYGTPSNDKIAKWESIHPLIGLIGCITSASKYPCRFNSESIKAGNNADIKKMADYLTRGKDIAFEWEELSDLFAKINPYADEAEIDEYLQEIGNMLPKLTQNFPF